ncbi:MAG: efflux transporter outer membrane subunit [Ideonella sp.]
MKRFDIRRPRRSAMALMLASALLLSGCGSMIPELKQPPLPVALTYPLATNASGQPVADIAWQDFFVDARLKRLISLALDSNRDLRLAVLAIEQSRAQLQLRRADQLPTVGAGLSASRAPTGNGQSSTTYTAGLQIAAWEIDFFGRIRSLSEAARAQLLATEEARKTVQISLIAAIAQTHLAMQADEALLAVTRQTLDTRQQSMKLTQLKFDNGATSELELRQAESLLEAARVALAQQTRQRALDENALQLLVGQPLPADLPPLQPLASGISADATPAELPAGLPSDLLIRRPDVRAAEQQMVAANANIGAARAAFFPRISLTTSAGFASNELSSLFSGGLAWTFAPQLLQPIFDAGRNQANLQGAQIARDIATVQYEKAIQTAFREVADGLAGQATLSEQARAQAAQTNAEQVRMKLADLRYSNGISSYLDILDAQRSLFAAQQALVQIRLVQLQNRVGLYKALGGGWTEAAPASR